MYLKKFPLVKLKRFNPITKADRAVRIILPRQAYTEFPTIRGRAANCRWRLESDRKNVNQSMKVGYANWTDFYPNNEQENLFYIEVAWETNEVTFQHKANPKYDGKAQLRNASETAKVIRTLNEVLTTDTWAKYLTFNDINKLRREVVHLLITSNASFIEIKRKYTT